jgi:hypothetical protein
MGDIIKSVVKLSPSAYRKFTYILKSNERKRVLDEAMYYSNIYNAVDDAVILQCLIEKYIKIKLHHHFYQDIKRDVKEHLELIEEVYKNKILF